MIKIMLWNVRGIGNKWAEVWKIIQDYDICVLTEIREREEKKMRVAGYNVIVRNNNNRDKIKSGGIAIYVKKELCIEEDKANNKKTDEGLDKINIKIKGKKDDINLIGLYRRPGRIERKGFWKDLLKGIDKNSKTILLGDFNAHHVA